MVTEIDNCKYSLHQFPDYKIRCKVELTTNKGEHSFDIYTTNTDKESFEFVARGTSNEKIISFKIVHWATKEQDDKISEFLDEVYVKNI